MCYANLHLCLTFEVPTLAAMSNRTTFDPGTASVDQLAKAVGHHLCGWHYVELLLGMLMAFSIMGPALWLAWDYLWQQIERTKRQNAALVLDKLDGAALKRICGNANLPAWVRYPDFERVQWLNDLIDQLWPNAAAAAAGIVREQLNPQLQANKPAWIYEIGIQTFTLGDKPPRISAVKVFNTECVVDEVAVEMECIWNGSQRFQLAIRPLPRLPVGMGLGSALSKLLAMRVGVGKLWFKGKVRITLKPLLDRVPLVGAVKVSLVEEPDFSFSIQLQGGDITFLPGLELWLSSFIKDVLLQPYVLPEGVTIPLDPTAQRIEVPKGILYVRLLEAKNLPWLDWLTLPAPYVVLFVRGRRKHKTKVCKSTFHPRWDEEFVLLVHDPDHQDLNAIIYDQDFIGADKEIGRVRQPIRELPNGDTEDLWLDVQPPEQQRSRNPISMGLAGVRSVSNIARDVIHAPFSLTRREPPKLHMQLTYHQIGEAEVKAATQAGTLDEAQREIQNPRIISMLRGGVLVVTVKKGVDEGPLGADSPYAAVSCNLVTVKVGDVVKGTAATEGEENPDWEETIEFAVPGDIVDRQDAEIEIRDWDPHWVNHSEENLTWEMHLWEREGVLHIPLRRVTEERHLEDAFHFENMDGEIELELRWIPILDGSADGAAT